VNPFRRSHQMPPRFNKLTQAVLDARALYLKRLGETIQQYGQPPYMHETVDPRTADRALLQKTPADIAQMAQVDPVSAEATTKRIEELRQRASADPMPPLTAPSESES